MVEAAALEKLPVLHVVHTTDPGALLALPAMQLLQYDIPVLPIYVPVPHRLHVTVPVVAAYFPVLQSMHVVSNVCEFWNWPTEHGTHALEPVMKRRYPAGQYVVHDAAPITDTVDPAHAVPIDAPAAEYVPAAQGVHAVAPAVTYVPAGHMLQLLPAQNDPEGQLHVGEPAHAIHTDAPALEYVPGPQGVHVAEPAVAANVPLGHGLQLPLSHVVPAGHVHEPEPAVEVEPAGHDIHSVDADDAVYEPAGHAVHSVTAPKPSPYWPIGQGNGAVMPAFGR